MPPKYKVEELLRVRDSVSESAVSIEKFADEDAIKEHVLRPSASTSRIGNKSENTAPPTAPRSPDRPNPLTATPLFPALANNLLKRPSPSPSLKKAKAERLLKEHGSPPGRRVTAGGRIVPTDWTWSGNHAPPYGRIAPFYPYQRPYASFFPGTGHLGDFPNGFVGFNIAGKLCQVVDGEMRELKDGNLFMAAPNIPFPMVNGFAGNSVTNGMARSFSQPVGPLSSASDLSFDPTFLGLDTMPYEKQIQHLEGEMKTAKQDHNQLERMEVLREHELSPLDRDHIVRQKRDLINKMDQIRKFKKGLEEFQAGMNLSPSNMHAQEPIAYAKWSGPDSAYASILSSHPNTNGFPAPLASPATNGWHGMPEPAAMSNYTPDVPPFVPSTSQSPNTQCGTRIGNGLGVSPVSIGGRQTKRSHAIEIKAPPPEPLRLEAKSALNPASPTYEPAPTHTVFIPPSPSPIEYPALRSAVRSTWANNNTDASESSVSTSNFFPNDAADHSQRKHTFMKPANAPPGAEMSAFSGQMHNTTPQRDWVRNAQMASQASSPEHNGQGRVPPVSPMETRMSSWTQDILPSLEPASAHQSPEHSRRNGMNSFYALNNTPAHTSARATPVRRSSALDGKSDEWCSGYMFGTTSSPDAQPDRNSGIEYKAGFYQGLADRKKKKDSFSTQTTPERGMSRHSSVNSLRKTNSNTNNMFGGSNMNDSAVNLPPIVENMRTGSGYPHSNSGPYYASSNGNSDRPMTNGYTPHLPSTQSFNALAGDSTHALFDRTNPRLTPSPTKRSMVQRGYSESAAGQVGIQTQVHELSATIDSDSAPFLWKEQHLRQQQIEAALKPLSMARSGNQLPTSTRVMSNTYNSQRYYPDLKTMIVREEPRTLDPIGTKRRPENVSQFDGASDDLAELDPNSFARSRDPPLDERVKTPPPAKDVLAAAEEIAAQSKNSSPRKDNPSPSKTKEYRDKVASTTRRLLNRGSDQKTRIEPSDMTPTEKEQHRSQWRRRFQNMKEKDREEVRKNRAERNKQP